MVFSASVGSVALPPPSVRVSAKRWSSVVVAAAHEPFPSFLPKLIDRIHDPFARRLAMRIQRLPVPVRFSENPIMSSCVKPLIQKKETPIVLLHGFDSSCMEWRYAYPLLEESGFETWAIDILGWGFSDLEKLPACDVVSKREHFYQFWKSYIKRPMILVGPSLGSAVAVDFTVNYPEAVEKLVLIDASVYAEGTGKLATLPKAVAYAGVGRLHCLMPWWDDATVGFMTSGGYNVSSLIEKVKQKTLIIWGENDRIISNKLAVQLHCELPDAVIRQIPNCGHIPHLEKPSSVVKLIVEFVQREAKKLDKCVTQV
ncbi:uncharacterized protein LOC107489571 isoform X5 [Arachis duranensis]|uniref:Uncharacterized protein LOC107489571 isoform X5 n=1 Tax=Arachis duranensis TaxID=130453 RepID=A0A6P5NPT6_ARADU|nr:uncharacterized protein LOC107489571 isoform X5 [Arachis duranensis]XP_025700273.1 uncharacterized protein LOC112801632 isoform X5 [Arachis hypogaea]